MITVRKRKKERKTERKKERKKENIKESNFKIRISRQIKIKVY